METEAEYKVSSQQPKLDEVLEKINEIAKVSDTGDYIYRGEPENYDKVSSSLYRESPDINSADFGIVEIQQFILEEARAYIGQTDDIDKTDDIGLLTEIQHFGGKTNLIDFTEDYLIALFFACDGSHEKDGRVILLKRKSEDYEIERPRRTINRVESQKSVFVKSPTGFVTPNIEVLIPADLKFPILDHLKKHHRISIATIYNDLHGFIRRSAHTEYLEGFKCQREASETENREEKLDLHENAIKHYTEALKLKPDFYAVYKNRAFAYRDTGDFHAAIEDFNKLIDSPYKSAWLYNNRGVAYRGARDFHAAIEDFNKAIDLAPEYAWFYSNRGETWLHLKEWQKAKADLTAARNMGFDIVASFQNAYKSVKEFEVENGVEMPKDIAALLSGIGKLRDWGSTADQL